jgi:hypothetical protein
MHHSLEGDSQQGREGQEVRSVNGTTRKSLRWSEFHLGLWQKKASLSGRCLQSSAGEIDSKRRLCSG